MSFKIGLWIFFIRKFGFASYLFIARVSREALVLGATRRGKITHWNKNYNKLSMEKYHNMERELKNIVLIFIYMYYLKPSENMFEVKWNFKSYWHAAREMMIKFLNATTYFCIVIVVIITFYLYVKFIYFFTGFLVDRKLALFLSPNFIFARLARFSLCFFFFVVVVVFVFCFFTE